MNYYELPFFKCVYFEDSYVLGIEEKSESLVFYLEVVLTEENPLYMPPEPGERYFYKKAILTFNDIRVKNWIERSSSETKDGSGSIDYGNIDLFKLEGGIYTLSGDWGVLKVECENIDFQWTDF
ncbi:hypothetical protein ACOTEK_16710 [Achromobacter xylosoxidans]|jgi:hypothetical protein|uniref:hypothetical protein n=2 Tax=Alcaligenes xylosoxydans xylosoxydans TaxID=85698 RepID=UPI0009BFDE49|nr:hypothetical protein [Achromobacter xylosoxidans]QQE55213.1 hypothetical protein I6H41_20005 [Achromobacter xylosoxidans]QQV14857.1 hypothetical protein I6I48_02945 [Achromobacter xylosoxidans]UXL04917.1 hypothetical protein N4T34_29475 [Achromobacter xylosoxidans]